jgi:hypothetical protein
MIGRVIVGIAMVRAVLSLAIRVGGMLAMFRAKPEHEDCVAMRLLSWPM